MEHQEFQKQINKLNEKFRVAYGNYDLIEDGPLNPQEFLKNNLKIVWVLKEGYGDAFSYTDTFINKYEEFYKEPIRSRNGGKTWQQIIRMSHAILTGKLDSGDNLNINDKTLVREILEKIAVINIQKVPAASRTNLNDIDIALKKYRHLIYEQINLLNPQIIICGNTCRPLFKDGLPNRIDKKFGYTNYYKSEGRYYIAAYHPSYTRFSRPEIFNCYCQLKNSILNN